MVKKWCLEDLRRNFQPTWLENRKATSQKLQSAWLMRINRCARHTFSFHSSKYLHHYSTQRKYNLMRERFKSLQPSSDLEVWKCLVPWENWKWNTALYLNFKKCNEVLVMWKRLSISHSYKSRNTRRFWYKTEALVFAELSCLDWASQELISQSNCTGIRSEFQLSTSLNWGIIYDRDTFCKFDVILVLPGRC